MDIIRGNQSNDSLLEELSIGASRVWVGQTPINSPV